MDWENWIYGENDASPQNFLWILDGLVISPIKFFVDFEWIG
jgi:hypothetical protein